MNSSIKNIWNQDNEIIKSNPGDGLQLFYKYNGIYYFKKLIEGENINLIDDPNSITIHSRNAYIRTLLIKGTADPEKTILQIRGTAKLYIKIHGATDIHLNCEVIVDNDNWHNMGVFNTEDDFMLVPMNPLYYSWFEIKLNNTKDFEYFFTISSTEPFLTMSLYYDIIYIS